MSIRVKILVPMVVVAVVCSIALGVMSILSITSFVSDFNTQQLAGAHNLANALLEQHREDSTRSSSIAAENEQLVAAVVSYSSGGDRQPLVDVSVSMMAATGVDFLTVMDPAGNVLVRAHEPDNFGDSLANQANVKNAMQGKQYTTTEKGSAVKLSVRCGTPIYDQNKNLIGVVSLGYRLDQSAFVDYVKSMTDTEVTVFLGDTRVSTTVLNEKGERAIDTQASTAVSEQVLAGNDYTGKATVVGKELITYYSPIRDVEGVVLGMLFVGLDTSATDAQMLFSVQIMVGMVVLLVALTVAVATVISTRIARPIREMSGIANRLAAGEVDVEIAVSTDKKSKDETVHLAQAFSEMILASRGQAQLIGMVADGDLSGTINPKSNKDVVGVALAELLDKNNAAFAGMSNAAGQLDLASSQIATGAQSLADGASEQSATIERLHVTLEELSGKTVENADHAKQAASLSESIKVFAERGSHQMAQMMEAVDQISKASESIGKVIKVIDDIAFQTNILALNAAVEAARAGQHGKGFAVVAEEVRNLAAKSADAAKDTGVLISNSIEKAKLGAQISSDTAASFAEIVEGINKSSVIVNEIAKFMQTQNIEIESVTSGVNEIGNVVHSVSAAAEQSAASSQELSSQAAAIAATLSEYKLRGRQSQAPDGALYLH